MMDRLERLVHEIHRRSLWQVLSVYVMGGWGAYQVVEVITFNAGLPDWVPSFALVVTIAGLPVVLATAMVQEGFGSRKDGPGPGAEDADGPGAESPAAGKGGPAEAPPASANLAAGTGSLDLPSTRPRLSARLFTWRNAVAGGVAAFGLLGLAVAGYFAMRSLGIGPVASLVAQGVIEERDPVVLADFGSPAADPALGSVVTEALRVDLLESQVLNLVDRGYLADVLRRMGRETGPLDASTAREAAIRDGLEAVIEGEVAALGSGFVLTARVVTPIDGRTVAAFRQTARDADGLLDAIEALSRDIREKAGESLRSVRAGDPLSNVTTGSLEALRLYTQALQVSDAGEERRAVGLLERAVEVDPAFAMAWRKLAVLRANLGRPAEEVAAAATRAWEERDRLTERERGLAEAYYASEVLEDRDRSVQLYRNVLDRHPDDPVALNNLALAHKVKGELAEAVELLTRAVNGPGETRTAHVNLIESLLSLDLTEAARAAERFSERYPGPAVVVHASVLIRSGRAREAEAHLRDALAQRPPGMSRTFAEWHLAMALLAQGRVREGEERLLRMESGENWGELRVSGLVGAASVILGDAERGLRHLDATENARMRAILPVVVYAYVGQPSRFEAALADARPYLDEQAGSTESLRAVLAAAEGRWEDAVRLAETSREAGDCPFCGWAELTLGHAGAGRPAEAEEAFRTAFWAENAGLLVSALLAPAHEALARAWDEAGDTARALEHYRAFVTQWEGADPPLQPRVEAARARIAELAGGSPP